MRVRAVGELMSQAMRLNLSKYVGVFGPIGAVGGFISDVVQPLAPLASYVFWLSLVATAALVLGVLLARSMRTRMVPPLVLTASFLVFSGAILLFQSKETEAKGVLATNFPFVAELQQTLGVIQKDVAEIKETTRKTAEAVSRVEDNTKSIATSLEAIKDGFAGLDKSGGIIQNAQKPEEHYHNARLYE